MKWTEGGGLGAYFYPIHRKLARTRKNRAESPQSIPTPRGWRQQSPQTLLKCSTAAQGNFLRSFACLFLKGKACVASCHKAGACGPAIAAIQGAFINELNLRPPD